MSLIPALGRKRQEDLKFKASLSYIVRAYLKKKKKQKDKPKSEITVKNIYTHIHTPFPIIPSFSFLSFLLIFKNPTKISRGGAHL
jgi:hypothetical protein